MALSNKKRALTAILANISRLLLSAVLMVSGFVKAVDPMGLFYKVEEYLAAFGITELHDGWITAVSVTLPALEFIFGVMLLMGVYNRVVTTFVFLFFLMFTPFTLIIALWNPVSDCGCFGDAFVLSNWATFAKNIVLLILATMVCFMRRLFVRKVSLGNRWMVALFALLYISAIEYIGLAHLPIMDFRPFAVGTDLRKAVVDVPSLFKTVYRFEKDGEVKEYDDETYPDTTWNYLGSRTDILVEGKPALIADFAFLDMEEGDDYAETILEDSGYVYMLILEKIETADESRVDKINELYDYCHERAIPFYAATASDTPEVDLWKKRTGADYPILWADDVMLKTMIRSNPGVLLVKDGVVVAKWNVKDLPSVDDMRRGATLMPEKSNVMYQYLRSWKLWLLFFVAPILFIAFIDVLIVISRKLAARLWVQKDDDEEKE